MLENTYPIPILTLLLFTPVMGVILLSFMHASNKDGIRFFTLGVTGVTFLLSLMLLFGFDASTHKMQFVESVSWIPEIGVSYLLGVDGMSLLLLLLTTFIAVIGVLCSWTSVEDRIKGYMACILIMETGMIGVFITLDLVLFFLFWEIGLVPMYFLIGIWGGRAKTICHHQIFPLHDFR